MAAEVEGWISTWTVPMQYVLGAFTGGKTANGGIPKGTGPVRTEQRGNSQRRWTDLDALDTPEHVSHMMTNLQRSFPFADPLRKAVVDRRQARARAEGRVRNGTQPGAIPS